MYSVVQQGSNISTYLQKYVCDTSADIDTLPKDVMPGSMALIIESGNTYILNNLRQWVLFVENGNSSGSGSGLFWVPF